MKQAARKIGFITVGCCALVIGVIGLLVPIIPGVLFLAVAAVAFVGASSRLQRQLRRSRRFRPYFERYDAAHGLTEFERFKLAGWLSMSALGSWFRGR